MKQNSTHARLMFGVIAAIACTAEAPKNSEEGAECTDGTEGCLCHVDGTCDPPLTCSSSRCVTLPGGASGSAGDTGTGGSMAGTTAGGSAGNNAMGASNATGGDAGSGNTGTGGTTPDSRAPVILSLATNVATLGPGNTLVITALVTDPDGIDDVIGGTVQDPVSGGTYGALQSQAQEGSYSLSLSFGAIEAVRSTDSPPGGTQRTFEARFADAIGNFTSDEVSITLVCDEPDEGLCDGSCTNLEVDDENCGTCRKECGVDATSGECAEGLCFDYHTVTEPASCATVCQGVGQTCAQQREGSDGPYVGTAAYSLGAGSCFVRIANCSDVPAEQLVPPNCGTEMRTLAYQGCYCHPP